MFEGLKIGFDKILVTYLQFADDTILMGKASVGNAKALKGILRIFEVASGLKVNFQRVPFIE